MTLRPTPSKNASCSIRLFVTNIHTVHSSVIQTWLQHACDRRLKRNQIIRSLVTSVPCLFPKNIVYESLTSIVQNFYCPGTVAVVVQQTHNSKL